MIWIEWRANHSRKVQDGKRNRKRKKKEKRGGKQDIHLGRLEFRRTAEESADPAAPELEGAVGELIGEKRANQEGGDGDGEVEEEREVREIEKDGIKP